MTMSSSTVLYVFLIGLCVVSVHGSMHDNEKGLKLRLKGKEMIPNNGEVVITDLPVGGCRRYDSLECLSHVEYQGRVLKAYWKYTNTTSLQEFLVEDFRCQFRRNCKSPGIGWLSARGIYRKGKSYYNVLRLGRVSEKAAVGLFTCNFEEDNEDPVSVNIVPYAHPSPLPPPSPTSTPPVPPVSETPIPTPFPDPSTPPVRPSSSIISYIDQSMLFPTVPVSETPIPTPFPDPSTSPVPPVSETPIPTPSP